MPQRKSFLGGRTVITAVVTFWWPDCRRVAGLSGPMDFLLSLARPLLLLNAEFQRVMKSVETSLLAFLNGSGSILMTDVVGGVRVSKDKISDERCKLPEDCMYEILSRVDVSTLPSCLRVCRSWRLLAYQPTFQALHSLATKRTSGFLLGTVTRSKMKCSFLLMDALQPPFSVTSLLPQRLDAIGFKIQATCPAHCLLLSTETLFQPNPTSNQNHRYYVFNYYVTRFGTSHHRRIPNPRIENLDYFSCISGTDAGHFKIVRIYIPPWKRRREPSKCICEIFDSTVGQWRFSAYLPYIWKVFKDAVVVNQTAFWLVLSCAPHILSFDIEKERGRVVPVPEMIVNATRWPWKWQLVACEDKLCLVHLSSKEVKFWTLMEEDGEYSGWEWKGSVSVHYLMDHRFAFENGIQDDQVVLLETLYRELWYAYKGNEYSNLFYPPRHVWRMRMDVAS